MIAIRPAEASSVTASPPDLERFCTYVRSSSPFEVNRVVQVFAEVGDVAPIHERQFAHLRELAGRAQRQQPGVGVVLWGDPGIGKSHLLARLSCWAGREQQQAVFIYLANLQASPEALPGSLLRCVLSILTDGRDSAFHLTPLYRMMLAAIQRALRSDGGKRFTPEEALTAYRRLIDELYLHDPSRAALGERAVFNVLYRFWFSAFGAWKGSDDGLAALAVRWLAGDFLDADEARRLDLPRQPGGTAALADEQAVKGVLVALIQLAAWQRKPVILCFDQVDNLDEEQFSALARFLHALLDSTGNLLVVTSGVQQTLLGWKTDKVIQQSSWDRLAQHEIELQPIGVAQARQMVQARLQPLQETFRAVEPVWQKVQQDVLFPLGERWAQTALAERLDIRPRDVINWARAGWRQEQAALQQSDNAAWLVSWPHSAPAAAPAAAPPANLTQRIDDAVAAKVREHAQQKLNAPQTLPPDAEHLAGLLHRLLERCLQTPAFPHLVNVERLPAPKAGQAPPYHILLRQRTADGKDLRTGVLCVVTSDKKSRAVALRRLLQERKHPERLVIVTDERQPLELAVAGLEYLESLRRRHGQHYHVHNLLLPDYAELDGLQAVLGQARSGDLAIELPGGTARPVVEKEVVESHFRQQRFTKHPLLKLLLG